MSYKFFDDLKFRNDVARYATETSFRKIEMVICGAIKTNSVHRIVRSNRDLKISEVELLMKVIGTTWDDYIVVHMF